MVRSFGVLIVAVLLVGSAACFPEAEQDFHQTSEDVRDERVHREATNPVESTSALVSPEGRTAREQTAAATDSPVSWDYVALGDSLAVGVGARRGYVDRYAAYMESDTGAHVKVINLGESGQTSSELLYAVRNDKATRRALGAAEVVTFNIGINDLGHAGQAYENGACGASDNQQCLRAAVEAFKNNWEAIIAELSSLRSTEDTIIRTAGIGYTPRVPGVFKPYVAEVNHHIATTAAGHQIPYAQPYLDEGYVSPDGIHPNDDGYEVIAEGLRKPGYGPLGPAR